MTWSNLFNYPISALSEAAREGNVIHLQNLLHKKKDPNAIDHQGWTALHYAASCNQLECVKALLQDSRTDPLIRSHDGKTPAELAIASNVTAPVVQVILEKGGRNAVGPFYLHVACFKGNLDVVELLVKSGANMNIREEINEQTPLHRAIEGKQIEIVKFLLNVGANVNIGDRLGCSPLFEAVNQDSVECAKVLLEAGADPDLRTSDGLTPLMMACQLGNVEMVRLLLSHGAQANLFAKDHTMAITLAVHGGWVDIVRLVLPLTSHKVLVKAATSSAADNVSLFCMAIDSESDECLSILLDADLPMPLKIWPLYRTRRDMQPHVRYTKCGPMSFLLMDKMTDYGDRTITVLEKLINGGFPVNVKKKGELPPLVAALLFPLELLQPPVGQLAILDRLIAAGADVDYRSVASNKLPDALLAACLKCNGPALKTLLPHSAVCPHQLLENFIAGQSTIFCYYLIAEASLGDDFTGLEKKVNALVQPNSNCLWYNFLPRLREQLPSLQAMARRKVRECLRASTKNTQLFLESIEDLNVPCMIKNYLRFKV